MLIGQSRRKATKDCNKKFVTSRSSPHAAECQTVHASKPYNRRKGLFAVSAVAVIAICGEGEDVVHTLLSGVVQVCHELLVGEEEEKEEEQGRQEEKEVKGEGQSEENTRTWMTMWMV